MAAANEVNIEYADRLGVLLTTPKRLKILVGGRASTKSTFVADHVLSRISAGERWCCAREHHTSIDDSVHSLLLEEIERLNFSGFDPQEKKIKHDSGGEAFYKGLARNVTNLKGLNCHGLWIEEGEATSRRTLKTVTASIRVTALQQQQIKQLGQEMEPKEIWITMNRGSRKDAIAQQYLKRAEKELAKCGYYEDDFMIAIEINYPENPWYYGSGLEQERLDDLKNLSKEEYDHKWNGAYYDSVKNAIIKTEWFDACIDAHKKLGFDPEGIEVIAHDPNDGGDDDAAIAYRHGSVFKDVRIKEDSTKVNETCRWALNICHDIKPDHFVWDSDGVGAGLREQINDALTGKRVAITAFHGGHGVDDPASIYQPIDTDHKQKTNKEQFYNRRAQYYWALRDRCLKTYLAVTEGRRIHHDDLISFSSDIKHIDLLRAEICRIPLADNRAGKIQVMSKEQMAKQDPPIASPNMADSVMMALSINKPSAIVSLGAPSTFY
jgi:phage terminase large subunit